MKNEKKPKKVKLYKKKVNNKDSNVKWILFIILWTFIISGSVGFTSDIALSRVNISTAFVILLFIIAIGIAFDIIGVAVTAAEETPFHSMASRKVKGAKTAVGLIRNANKVSNFCNDVIGDISGIISGTTGAVIISKIIYITGDKYKIFLTLIISATIASITVAGKAIGKNYAISQSNNIVYSVAWLLETLKRK